MGFHDFPIKNWFRRRLLLCGTLFRRKKKRTKTFFPARLKIGERTGSENRRRFLCSSHMKTQRHLLLLKLPGKYGPMTGFCLLFPGRSCRPPRKKQAVLPVFLHSSTDSGAASRVHWDKTMKQSGQQHSPEPTGRSARLFRPRRFAKRNPQGGKPPL